jgi:hypothetical protein
MTVTYVPPDDRTLDRFAFAVCDHLGDDYSHPDVKRGLAAFLKVATLAYAHQLNREVLDNGDESP